MTLQLHHKHSWNVTPQEAIVIQEELRSLISTQPLSENEVRLVGGVDTAFYGDLVIAAAVVMDYPSLERIEQSTATGPVTFPYIPGLLSFREAPAVLASLGKLENLPDVLLVDGHGLAHPRRFGIASHIGVLLNISTIGCAKSLLIGKHDPLAETVGSCADIHHEDEIVGVALRTRQGVKPLYVSVGHKIDLQSAIRIVLLTSSGFRLPEPSRCAHHLAAQKRLNVRKN
jgi:deoxyribonuclease V